MTLQVLVSTMNQSDYSLLDRMNIQSDAVVVNQCEKDAIELFKYHGHSITWISMSQRGVGLSRNICLFNASADIILWADDDIQYQDGYPEEVVKTFENNHCADIVCFNVDLINSTKNTGGYRYNKYEKRLHFFNAMRYGACVIAARRKAILRERIAYSLLFGGGSEFSSGEDSLFIVDCLRAKLKIYSSPYVLGEVEDSSSSWYMGLNDKLFEDRGMLLSNAFPILHRVLFVYYAFRMSNLDNNYNAKRIIKLFRKGKIANGEYR